MTFRGTAAALAVFAVLATACADTDGLVDGVTDVASEIADGLGTTDDGAGGTTDGGSQTTSGGDGATTQGGGDDGGNAASTGGDAPSDSSGSDAGTPRVAVEDLGPVGANGRAMLRGSYPALVIEVDVQSCTSADQAAVEHLVATLRSVADKPGGIALRGGNTFESDRRQWTSADLRANAQAHRSTRSAGDEVSLYVQYVCGAFHAGGQETSAIGVAYNASEFAIFPQRWNDGIGVLLGSNRAVERAVLVHELGHILGLVNLTYDSEIDHEDPEHPGHSKSRSSAMYWAIESTAIGQVFSGPPPDRFDDADRADLDGLKSGRY